MGTHARIAIKTPSGYTSIYCHWSGYPEGVGALLKKYYNNSLKIKKLIALGDINSLGKNIGIKHPFSPFRNKEMSLEKFNKIYNDMTTSYSRDRGERNTRAKLSKSLANLKDRAGGAEYLYIFSNGRWMAYEFEYNSKNWLPITSYNKRTAVKRVVKRTAVKRVVKRTPVKRVVKRTAVKRVVKRTPVKRVVKTKRKLMHKR